MFSTKEAKLDEEKQTVYLRIYDADNLHAKTFNHLSKTQLVDLFLQLYVGKNMRDVNLKLGKEKTCLSSKCNSSTYKHTGDLELRLPTRLLHSYEVSVDNMIPKLLSKMMLENRTDYHNIERSKEIYSWWRLRQQALNWDTSTTFFVLEQDYHLKEEDIQRLWFVPSHLYRDEQGKYLDKNRFPYPPTCQPASLDFVAHARKDLPQKMSLFHKACLFVQGQRQSIGNDGTSPCLLHGMPNEVATIILKQVEELEDSQAQRVIDTAYHYIRR